MVVTPARLDALRIKLLEEVEAPYKERFIMMESDINASRSDFNKLRYDYAFLKSEYENEQKQHRQILEEMQAQYELEISSLRKERDGLLQKQQHDGPSDAQRVRTLQRENTQLHMKLKGLLSEIEEIRAQREAAGLQSDHVSRLQARQLTEMTARCKALETERDSLKQQCQTLQAELEKKNQAEDQLINDIHQLEKENMSLKSNSEETSHKHKLELSNLKMSLTKNRGDLERERDELKAALDACRNKTEVLNRTIEHLKGTVEEKEQDVSRRVQEVKEKEWEKISQLETTKLQLEASLSQMERAKVETSTSHQNQIELLEEKLRSTAEAKKYLEKEYSALKLQLKENSDVSNELERERAKSQEQRQKFQQLQNHYQSAMSNEQQLLSANDRLKSSVDLLNDELRVARLEIQRQQDDHLNALEQARLKFREEKTAFEAQITKLEKKSKEDEGNSKKAQKQMEKKRKKYKEEINQLRDRIQVLEKKEEQLALERDSERRKRELENEKTRRQMAMLAKKQNRFKNVLNNSHAFGGGLPMTSSPVPFNATIEQDRQLREIANVRDRLEDLEETQRNMTNILHETASPPLETGAF
ncbi:centrosomal protein of 83 kDa isoform X2 [Nematostella vectensis]|uniref:centrosomal protein of 83 kDa isoform X2 n=1 Tax=Nematostella vectensis TaxID=45351 RepID=UPI0020772F40|nr:centrosomal protein of 83 kDa isoform X2 [Nematostella vectensis]